MLLIVPQEDRVRQSRMDTFVTSRHCGPDKANNINDMVATDMLPISFVEGTGFRRLLQSLEPSYVPCSRKLITARLHKRYEECAQAIKTELNKATSVALTTDGWTALTTGNYVTIVMKTFITRIRYSTLSASAPRIYKFKLTSDKSEHVAKVNNH